MRAFFSRLQPSYISRDDLVMSLRITLWNEFLHEQHDPAVKAIYPNGIHDTLAEAIRQQIPTAHIHTATLDQPDHGLPDDLLDQTDVLAWWGHKAHNQVRDDIVEKIHARILNGMGALFLHSAHFAKPFKKLMGTSCRIHWREAAEPERLFIVHPAHPIADGLPTHIDISHEEMYGEFFDIPTPDELIMLSWFQGGNVFRSCCTWTRGKGKIVYFRPGHETHPTYHKPEIQRIICNALRWAAPTSNSPYTSRATHEPQPLSPFPH